MIILLLECLNSVCRDSANPWTANWAVEMGTRPPPLAPPESPATEDRATMCPLPARCIPGNTESKSWKNRIAFITDPIWDMRNSVCPVNLPKSDWEQRPPWFVWLPVRPGQALGDSAHRNSEKPSWCRPFRFLLSQPYALPEHSLLWI